MRTLIYLDGISRECWHNQNEFLLMGVRGKFKIDNKFMDYEERIKDTYEFIENTSPGPYLEVFGEKFRSGWSVVGI